MKERSGAAVKRSVRICFFGDSFVNGTGDPEHLGWPGRICALAHARGADLTHYNLGVRRDTSADVAARWRGEAIRRLPAEADGRLVFSFGVNDCAVEGDRQRVHAGDSLASAKSILVEASGWKPTLMIGPPPVAEDNPRNSNERVQALSGALGALCAHLGVPYLDVFGPLFASDVWREEMRSGDGAHPGARGYALLADIVSAWAAWRSWF